jgi:hypothetical protein
MHTAFPRTLSLLRDFRDSFAVAASLAVIFFVTFGKEWWTRGAM